MMLCKHACCLSLSYYYYCDYYFFFFYYYTLSLSLTYCNWPYTPILHSFPWGTQSRVSDSVNITTLELSIHPVCFSKHIHPSPS